MSRIKGKTAEEKTRSMSEQALLWGWSAKIKKPQSEVTILVLTRDLEMIEVRYDGNAVLEEPVVAYDGQIRRVRNPAAALRVVEQSAEENIAFFENRAEKKNAMRKAAPVKRSPGVRAMASVAHLAEMAEEDVRAKLVGKKLIWTNKISGDLQEDFVEPNRNKKPEHFNVKDGRVSFIGNYGFRSVKLDQLVAIR